ncbi:hypothetical protein GCM10020358_52520 [Amorphoplanes nipponensis]|uniref:Uncharacterized protein n=1 Tax=Actinoplanes nipponensis TaxID=135950 RepID=A0A919JI34_9ACTN|nr:hypothetical protein [Actinoplanes nipponensis]GIE49606.1 hypothetical protein Ani05nite_31400 [Actinoplanes nipponensis]
MRPTRTLASGAVLLLTTLASVAGTAGPASAAASAVPNSSFEGGWSGGKLACWDLSSKLGRLTLTRKSHHGLAAHAQGGGPAGTQLTLASDATTACRIGVSAGDRYRLRFWLRSTAGARPVVFAYAPGSGWRSWFTGERFAAASLRQYSVTLPAVPDGVTAVRVGVGFDAAGTVVLDDVTLTAGAGQVLFRPTFPDGDGLVTNDYAFWSPTDPRRAGSRVWDMTSGSLFAHDGNGYSGVPDDKPTDARSRTSTRSAIFRLTTHDFSFGDVSVRTTLKVRRLSSTRSTPAVEWDGVHLFLRYKSQYRLYYASVARRDGTVVIKKKCPGGRSNDGTYYELTREKPGYPIRFGTWQPVGATVSDNSDGSVELTVSIDGRLAAKATDRGVGCGPITGTGAVGIRADNAEFEFARYRVSSLD